MTDEALEERLRRLCEATPAPDPQRLAAVLRRVELAATRPHRAPRHWLPWLLLGGIAAAVAAGYHWYSGRALQPVNTANTVRIDNGPSEHHPLPKAGDKTAGRGVHSAPRNSENGSTAERPATVIYIR